MGHGAAVLHFPEEWKQTVKEFLKDAEIAAKTPLMRT
jgi:hypothetical protein